jgi:hypothetical protein
LPLTQLLQKDLQHYLLEHEHDDEMELVLKHKTLYGVPTAIVAEQLRGRRKAKEKLPSFYNTKNIIYPPQLNLEQCSSEVTAKFKSSLVKGHQLLDLTGGFGIDSLFFSKIFDVVHYVEPDDQLHQIFKHNAKVLGSGNITFHHQPAEEFLKTLVHTGVVYIDPSRRSGSAKTVKLADCSPDITALQSELLKKASQLLVKASPLLDIQQGLRELNNVSDVYVVSVNNECKEVLFLCGQRQTEPVIHTVNLLSTAQQSFNFTFAQERAAAPDFSAPKTYLYEPNASILKGGAFKSIAVAFSVNKISTNTHLYTSEKLMPDFPGRVFKIDTFIKPDATSAALMLSERKANVITRNYPLTPDQLKKKLKLTDGGDNYIIAFSGHKKKHVALAKRVN